MNIPSTLRRIFVALGCIVSLAFVAAPAAHAADQAKSLPVTTSFHKGTPGEHGGPMVLVVKNTSSAALKVAATIVQSVASHNRPRTIDVPAKEVAAGASFEIADLAVDDVATLTAEGYAKLEVKVPATK